MATRQYDLQVAVNLAVFMSAEEFGSCSTLKEIEEIFSVSREVRGTKRVFIPYSKDVHLCFYKDYRWGYSTKNHF